MMTLCQEHRNYSLCKKIDNVINYYIHINYNDSRCLTICVAIILVISLQWVITYVPII
jgi:hypothetical protein